MFGLTKKFDTGTEDVPNSIMIVDVMTIRVGYSSRNL